MDGRYVKADGRRLDVLLGGARFDVIVEATGVSSLVFQAMCLLNYNGVLCVAGLPEGNQSLTVPADCIGLEMVLENRIFFGTVSSNVSHFRRTLELMQRLERRFPGALASMLTDRHSVDNYEQAFQSPAIKAVLTF